MKEELCEKFVEVQRKSDRVMAMVLAFEELYVCVFPRLEDQSAIKINFIMTWQVSEICKALVKWFLVWGTLVDMLGDGLMALRVCMVGMELAKEMLREEDYSNFVVKRSCAWQIHGLKGNREK